MSPLFVTVINTNLAQISDVPIGINTMQRIPVEVAERIIANLSDKDLFIGSSVCRAWWQIVRQEAYKRWKEYACRIGDIYREIQAVREEKRKVKLSGKRLVMQ